MKNDGSSKVKISSIKATYINAQGNIIYCRSNNDDGYLYKIKTDGNEKTAITEESASYIHLIGSTLYYKNGTGKMIIELLEKYIKEK